MAVELTESNRQQTAFLFALEHEANDFRKLCPQAIVHIIGVGADRAVQNTRRLIENQQPAAIVLAGYAGALRPELKVGDIVIAKRIISCEPAAQARESTLTPRGDHSSFDAGVLLSVPDMIGEPSKKKLLHVQYAADVVDLESYAVAAVCDVLKIPWTVIRVISDDVNTRISPHVLEVIRDGRVSIFAVIKTMLRHPSSCIEFIRLGSGVALARRKLAQSLARSCFLAG